LCFGFLQARTIANTNEDGQFFEAEQIGRVEGAPDQDVAEVHTKQIPEDDVPSEHLEKD